jgi:hypothetical protein
MWAGVGAAPMDKRENLSTVGSGRVDALFDELELTIALLDSYADDVESLRRRIEANEGETSGHVRNRVNGDTDAFLRDLDAASERLADELRALKREV